MVLPLRDFNGDRCKLNDKLINDTGDSKSGSKHSSNRWWELEPKKHA